MQITRNSTKPAKRVALLAEFVLIGFALRLAFIASPDFDIDESWSFIHSFYIAHPNGATLIDILSPEPNNALHLLLASILVSIAPDRLGIRLLSVFAGTITVALTARIAFRLYGQKAAFIAAIITSTAIGMIDISQLARPYGLAMMFALLATVGWLERRWRLNMYAGIAALFSHVAVIPILMAQDGVALYRHFRRERRLRMGQWLFSRVLVYGSALLITYMLAIRRSIHVISSGQTVPQASEILNHLISSGFGSLGMIGIVLLVLLFVSLIIKRLQQDAFPLLWIVASYFLMIFLAAVSDGAVKWVHLTHVGIALLLLVSGILSRLSKRLYIPFTAVICVFCATQLYGYYAAPYAYWSNVHGEIEEVVSSNPGFSSAHPIFLQQTTVLWAIQLNNPNAAEKYSLLPPFDERPSYYMILNWVAWQQEYPDDCTHLLWNDSNLHLIGCTSVHQ